MSRYVKAVECAEIISKELNISLGDLVDIFTEIPTADVVEVKHGKWKKGGNEKTCSACKFIYYSNNDDFNYCPNCGAKWTEGAMRDG